MQLEIIFVNKDGIIPILAELILSYKVVRFFVSSLTTISITTVPIGYGILRILHKFTEVFGWF